jgi:hypothetical protein
MLTPSPVNVGWQRYSQQTQKDSPLSSVSLDLLVSDREERSLQINRTGSSSRVIAGAERN